MFGVVATDLHLELTTRCTLACPRCPRTLNPEEYAVGDLPLAAVRAITRAAFPALDHVFLSGNYGDPIYHKHFHAVLEHLKGEGIGIRMDTNGSYRPRAWWERTASLLERRDRIALSIDGLEDTNHLYRVNSRWADVMTAASVLQGRVWLAWKFIVFRHNQHQIDEASALAKDLGFDEFKLVRSDRFGGKWVGADGVDPLQPDPEWLSDRAPVANQIMRLRSAQN